MKTLLIVAAVLAFYWLMRRVFRRIETILTAYEYMTMCPSFLEECNRLVDEKMKKF